MTKSVVVLVCVVVLLAAPSAAAPRPLEVYFIDVEGGNATLIIGPAGQSMLIDAGWPGPDDRDADRIIQVVKVARLKQIDYMVVTHYDTDHVDNVPRLIAKLPIPVRAFVDHGGPVFHDEKNLARVQPYFALRNRARHIVPKPGDLLPMKAVQVKVVTSAGETIQAQGDGTVNAACTGTSKPQLVHDENEASLGLLFTYGKFRMLDLADLLAGKEHELICPNNPIGTASVFIVDAHGLPVSNTQELVHGVKPQVAIMNNAAHKGGGGSVWDVLSNSPSMEDVWQLHYSVADGERANPPAQFVLSTSGEKDCEGGWFKLSAWPDGSFQVSNSRTGFSKTYKPRQGTVRTDSGSVGPP